MGHENPAWEQEALRFRASLADLLFAWNRLEAATRYLLEICSGVRSFEGQIPTADMGNVKVRQALLAVTETAAPQIRDHVAHYLKGFERLRTWRNYLIHGPVGVVREGDRIGGLIHEIQVQNGRLSEHNRTIEAEDVERITQTANTFHIYLSRIIGEVYNAKSGSKLFSYDPLNDGFRPDLPDQLQRERIYVASSHAAPPTA